MKSKFYWQRRKKDESPFELPQRIAEGINSCRKSREDSPAQTAVRYVWIHLTREGLYPGQGTRGEPMNLDDWLNIIDESAALGAQWVVIYVGASLGEAPIVWELCKWSQEIHGLNIGLHLRCDCLSVDDVERVSRLDRERTFLVADGECMDALNVLRDRGLSVCKSDLHLRETLRRCTKPADMACVGPDGHMFSCGLVLGETEFALGHARDRVLAEVIGDGTLPHEISDAARYPTRGCEGCPPYVAEQAEQLRGAR